MRSEANSYLRNFYIIVPALMSNFIDYLLEQKLKLPKKAAQVHKDGYVFTDDGLAIGIAYILKLINIQEQFESLRWFDSVFETYAAKEKEWQAKLGGKLKKEDLQSVEYNIQHIRDVIKEYHLLRFTFAGAKIFFDSEKDN